ncbi:uncharacterized protein LOC105689696 [Athalia rosae]|uniref:uncharacterized protein LOC105689696 n=1 Tax=Athalia rosae TaxID=37344 RepID=UPI002033622B|nr:uncharacterized protein LOC105689696 [Athalia rosae]
MNPPNQFALIGGDSAFADRQKRLSDQLSIAEKQCNKDKNTGTDHPMEIESCTNDNEGVRLFETGTKPESETMQFCDQESIFKRPLGPAPRSASRRIPDHRRNPHKWRKYSLENVSSYDMSDSSNTKSAVEILVELRAQRAKEKSLNNLDSPMESDDNTDPNSYFIPFKPPHALAGVRFKKLSYTERSVKKKPAVVVEREEKPIFLNTKVVMPEYVVGQKKKRKGRGKKRTSELKVERTKELKLNHLEEFDKEDDQ